MVKPAEPHTSRSQANPKSPNRDEEFFATPAVHSPVPSTDASSQRISNRPDSRSHLTTEEASEGSSKSVKRAQREAARKSRQIPVLAHDIELRNRKILMDEQNKVRNAQCPTTSLGFLEIEHTQSCKL